MELLLERGAHVSYNDSFIPKLPPMRHHSICRESQTLSEEFLRSQDCVLIVTDHSDYNYEWIAKNSRLVVDTRNAMQAVSLRDSHIWKA
jgi:UDP-N-acetyl-D-glucosamine dehydrogenase